MKNSHFKEIIRNVFIFALLLVFFLWGKGPLDKFLPSLGFLLLATLILELTQDLSPIYRTPGLILSLLFYPLGFNFLIYAFPPGFFSGLLHLFLLLYFLRLLLSYKTSLLDSKKKKRDRFFLALLLALVFGFIFTFFQLDQKSLTELASNLSLAYTKKLYQNFSLEKSILLSLGQILFLYGLDWILPKN